MKKAKINDARRYGYETLCTFGWIYLWQSLGLVLEHHEFQDGYLGVMANNAGDKNTVQLRHQAEEFAIFV